MVETKLYYAIKDTWHSSMEAEDIIDKSIVYASYSLLDAKQYFKDVLHSSNRYKIYSIFMSETDNI